MEKEIWKDIPGYEGMYQVSSEGRVKSLDKERYLTQSKGDYGYSQLILYKDGIRKNYRVHKLVAMSFLDHKPSGYEVVVDHINNDKSDNRLSNLQLVSNRENSSKDKNPRSGFTGVSKTKSGRYTSKIKHKSKRLCLGTFDKPEEAYEAYLNKIKEIEGLV